MRGKNLHLFAAIKSLPLAASSASSASSDSPSPSPRQQSSSSGSSSNAPLARALLSQVEEQLAEVERASSSSSNGPKAAAEEEDATLAAEAAERRLPGSALAAVLRYRAERGALLRAARAALRLYCAGAEEE